MTTATSSAQKIEFKRGKRKNTEVSDRMVYESWCGRWKLEHFKCRFSGRVFWQALWYGDHYGQVYWANIVHMKTYRTRKAAERACEAAKKAGILDSKRAKRKFTPRRSR